MTKKFDCAVRNETDSYLNPNKTMISYKSVLLVNDISLN